MSLRGRGLPAARGPPPLSRQRRRRDADHPGHAGAGCAGFGVHAAGGGL